MGLNKKCKHCGMGMSKANAEQSISEDHQKQVLKLCDKLEAILKEFPDGF